MGSGYWEAWTGSGGAVLMSTRGWEHATPHDTRHRRALVVAKPSKYHAQPTVVDGFRFDSKREAERYLELKVLVQGTVEVHPRFPLYVGDVLIATYEADFRYETPDGEVVVEDVKGVKTAVYRLKKKLVEVLYGIKITEVR